MVIREVKVSYGLTYSNRFNGARIDVEFAATIGPEEDAAEAQHHLTDRAHYACVDGLRKYLDEREAGRIPVG